MTDRTAIHKAVAMAMTIAAAFVSTARAQQPLATPSPEGQLILIRNTLTALSHANLSGNYTVLHSLASERFQKQYQPADLATVFQPLRASKLNLGSVLTAKPILSKPPEIDTFRGRLQLVGHVPLRSTAVRFLMTFQHTPQGWTIDDLAVTFNPPAVAAASPTPGAPQYPVRQAAANTPASRRQTGRRLPSTR